MQQPKGALALGKPARLATRLPSLAVIYLTLNLTRLLNLDDFSTMDMVLLLLCRLYTLAASNIIAAEIAAVEAW